jgi:5,6-dimethylbenzimidazole synthase
MSAARFTSDFQNRLDDLLIWRRDVRHFETRALEDGMMDALLDRACLAPSVGNSQPWRFVRVMSPELRQKVVAHVEQENVRAGVRYDSETQADYRALKLHGLHEAPEHLAVFCDMKTDAGRGLGRQTMPETLVYSTLLAVHTLWLAARARGIGMGWVSILEPVTVAAMLDVPADWRFIGYLCLGYATEDNAVAELERRGWQDRLDPALTRVTR